MFWLKIRRLAELRVLNIGSGKLNLNQQIQLFEFLSDLLGNGFSLQEILRFYQTVNGYNNVAVNQIIQRLSQGIGFSESIRPFIQPDLYYQLKIAEYHGNILAALKSIKRLLRAKSAHRSRIKEIIAYPLFLLILLIGIIIGIKIFVTPQLAAVGASSVHFPYVQLLSGVFLLALIGLLFWFKFRRMNEIEQANLISKVPVIGKLYRYYYAYYFANNLAFMIGNGMDVKEILRLMLTFDHHSLIYWLALEFKTNFNRGRSWRQVTRRYLFFPSKIIIFLEAGDSQVILTQKLKAYSELCFKRMFKLSTKLVSALQPLTFLIIGSIIVGTYLSMLLPMYGSLKGVYN